MEAATMLAPAAEAPALRTQTLANGDMIVLHVPTGRMTLIYRENVPLVRAWIDDPRRERRSDDDLADRWRAGGYDDAGWTRPFVPRDDESSLHLILLPTESCNLRCAYCYESLERGAMPVEVREAIVRNLTARVSSLRHLRVEWFGGEPLLGWEVIEDLAPRIRAIAADAQVSYTMSITTNGTLLTPPRLKFLVEQGCQIFQITLDGPQHWHDRRRKNGCGDGTFDRVWQTLKSIHESKYEGIAVVVRLNVDRDSLADTYNLIDDLAVEFAGDPRFAFYARNLWRGRPDAKIAPMTGSEGFQAVYGLTRRIIERSLAPYWIVGMGDGAPLTCYAARRGSFVIGSDGSLYKCTVAFDLPENRIGRILPDGTLAIDVEKHDLWISAGREDARCTSCFLLSRCHAGACPRTVVEKGEIQCPYEREHWEACMGLLGLFYQRNAQREGTRRPAPRKEEVVARALAS